jgi:hypothetical protein
MANISDEVFSATDAGATADWESKSKYWPSATRAHSVVFPDAAKIGLITTNVRFEFKPAGGPGKSGVVEGGGIAFKHKGKYEILNSTADTFVMRVTVGTAENPTEDMDATLSIDEHGATVSGTLKGEVQTAGTRVPVTGSGTQADPYAAKFPTQEVDWYLP